MQLKWGNIYSWDQNSLELSTRRRILWNKGGQPYAENISFEGSGYLIGNGQAAISAAMIALEKALQTPFQDLVFLMDNGQPSATILKNSTSITGVRVTSGPNYPTSHGPEYANQRKWTATWEAEYPLVGSDNLLLSWTESLSLSGGKPRYVCLEALNAPPQRQQVCFQEPFRATQRGVIVGYRRLPDLPPPIFPAAEVRAPEIDKKSPERMGNGHQGYELSYSYEFISPTPLFGVPSVWIR